MEGIVDFNRVCGLGLTFRYPWFALANQQYQALHNFIDDNFTASINVIDSIPNNLETEDWNESDEDQFINAKNKRNHTFCIIITMIALKLNDNQKVAENHHKIKENRMYKTLATN